MRQWFISDSLNSLNHLGKPHLSFPIIAFAEFIEFSASYLNPKIVQLPETETLTWFIEFAEFSESHLEKTLLFHSWPFIKHWELTKKKYFAWESAIYLVYLLFKNRFSLKNQMKGNVDLMLLPFWNFRGNQNTIDYVLKIDKCANTYLVDDKYIWNLFSQFLVI